MDNGIIPRTIQTTLVSSGFLFPFLTQSFVPAIAWGVLLGTLLSALNLFLLSWLFQALLIQNAPVPFLKRIPINPPRSILGSLMEKGRDWRLLIVLKLAGIYGLICFLFYGLHLAPYAIILGFSFPLMIIVLKGVARVRGVQGGQRLELKSL